MPHGIVCLTCALTIETLPQPRQPLGELRGTGWGGAVPDLPPGKEDSANIGRKLQEQPVWAVRMSPWLGDGWDSQSHPRGLGPLPPQTTC